MVSALWFERGLLVFKGPTQREQKNLHPFKSISYHQAYKLNVVEIVYWKQFSAIKLNTLGTDLVHCNSGRHFGLLKFKKNTICPAIKLKSTLTRFNKAVVQFHNAGQGDRSCEKALGPLPFSLCCSLITNF